MKFTREILGSNPRTPEQVKCYFFSVILLKAHETKCITKENEYSIFPLSPIVSENLLIVKQNYCERLLSHDRKSWQRNSHVDCPELFNGVPEVVSTLNYFHKCFVVFGKLHTFVLARRTYVYLSTGKFQYTANKIFTILFS